MCDHAPNRVCFDLAIDESGDRLLVRAAGSSHCLMEIERPTLPLNGLPGAAELLALVGGYGIGEPVLPELPESGTGRRRLWELKASYHCPVIGTCLSVGELRKLSRQTGIVGAARFSDYELHAAFVNLAGEPNPASRRLHKRLDEKFAATLRRFAPLSDTQAVRQAWRTARERGDIAAALWAAMTHPQADAELMQEIYREVHMLSHQIGAGLRADLKRLAELEQENGRLTHELTRSVERSARSLAEKEQTLRELELRLGRTTALEGRLAALESGATLATARERIAGLERELAAQQRRTDRAERLVQALEQRNTAVAHLPPQSLPTPQGGETTVSEEPCPPDLCGRCVLCVGGLTGAASHYRKVVERCNGQFLHHDGGLEESAHRLQALLARADVVVCPADCVSHNAYWRVKRLCKAQGKPCLMLPSSGVSGLAQALVQFTPA